MLSCITRIKRAPIFPLRNLSSKIHVSFGERRALSQPNTISTPQHSLLERNAINELKKYGIHIPQPDYGKEFLPFSANLMECDSANLMIMKLSEGHKLTSEILEHLYSKSSEIDPSVSPEFLLMRLNNLGICGKNIHKLFNACEKNPVYFIALIRANQLKLIDEAFIYETIITEHLPYSDDLLKKVQKNLFNFNNSSKQTIKE